MSDQGAPQKPAGSKTSTPKTFKPRAGIQRRSAAELEKYAKQEAERRQARLAEGEQQSKATKTTPQGTRAGRGRGGANLGRGGRTIGDNVGRGVFGAGSGERPATRTRGMEGGHSEMLEGQNVKPEDVPMTGVENEHESTASGRDGARSGPKSGTKSGGTTSTKQEDVVHISEDDEPDEPRRDIEKIWLSSDDGEEDIVTSKGKQRATNPTQRTGGGLRPVRAARAAKEKPDELFQKAKTRKLAQAQKSMEDHEMLDVDDDIAEVDMVDSTTKDPPSSPELSKKAKPTKRPGTKAKDAKLLSETLEEKAERLRTIEDVRKIRSEFTQVAPIKAQDTEKVSPQNSALDLRDGKLFLFQLPPLVPFLKDPATAEEEVAVKQEGEDAVGAETTNAKNSDIPGIKKDPDGIADKAKAPQLKQEGCYTAADKVHLPTGLLGKLRIHKSGKVSLDWAGTDMEVRYGTEVDFLQDAVLVETPEEGVGTTYALGQVRKKMVVVPDWAKLYD